MVRFPFLLLGLLVACSGDDTTKDDPTEPPTDGGGGGDDDDDDDDDTVPDDPDGDNDGYRVDEDDCNDDDPTIHPGAPEICDGIDQDCDDAVDDDPVDGEDWYPDADGDGAGDGSAQPVSACEAPPGLLADDSDCDDTSDAIYPGAPELCNGGVDDDCDPATVESATLNGVTYAVLQDALDAAVGGDVVELCDGALMVRDLLVADKDLTLRSASGDPATVTLDAANMGTILRVQNGAVTLEGLTFTGATTTAVTVSTGSLAVESCVFEDNRGVSGGAISGPDLTITGSELRSNRATYQGGAIFLSGGALTVQDSVFEDNSSDLNGGAIGGAPTSVAFTDVTFEGNSAVSLGGGVFFSAAGATADLVGTTFTDHSASTGGGWWSGGMSVSADSATLFERNTVTFSGAGAWFQSDDQAVTWQGGSFVDNYAVSAGGGIYAQANDATTGEGSVELSDLYADGNTADLTGGGIYLDGEPMTLRDSVTVNNVSDYGGGTSINLSNDEPVFVTRVEYRGNMGLHGGATDLYLTLAVLEDCVIEENVGTVAGGIYVTDDTELRVITSDFGTDVTENTPTDVTIETTLLYPPVYEEYVDYGAQVSFTCVPTVNGCQ